MKTCSKCNTSKKLDEFGKNKSRVDGLQRYCLECGRAYNRAHYLKHPEKRIALNQKAMARAQQFIWDYRCSNPCIDCGESDPIVLQFDHVRGSKLFNISEAAASGYSLVKITEEISKCDVRCANCHIRKTADRGDWFKRVQRLASVAEMD